ncbi:MAG: DNA polymerase I, partial [FCB group bacterium]|nr:DNA polymerase I [FCB group bacterium]
DHIRLYAPGGRRMEMKIYGPREVEEKWGLPPNKIIDLLGLMGDASDNIPGVRGVGEKSAVKLIREYGSLEGALEAAERIANKRVRTGLLECREEALLSKELVTIDTNVDIDINLDDMTIQPFDLDTLAPLFQELEFSGLVTQIVPFGGPSSAQVPEYDKPDKNYYSVTSTDELKEYPDTWKTVEWLSLDLETTSVDPMRAEIVGLSFSWAPDEGIYIPICYPENPGGENLEKFLTVLKPVLEDASIPKTGQNIKYDALILKRNGIEVQGIEFDTMIAAHLLNPDRRSYKLDNLARELLNYSMIPITDLIGSGRDQKLMSEVPLEQISFYAAEDADVALQLTPLLKKQLEKEQLIDTFENVEKPLISVLLTMEQNGVFIDAKRLNRMSVKFRKKLDGLSEEIQDLAGESFNLNSTQQLAVILFDKLGLPKIRSRSTAEEVLRKLVMYHELPGKILAYRKLNKLVNTYLEPLPAYIHPETGRVHSSFNQTVAATGRLSSSNPNFQNIPVRSEEGRDIRKAFCAQEKGWKILSADYSQIELRIMAHLSQDPGLIAAFLQGEDVHARTASLVYGLPLEAILPEMRRTAKIVNFGIMYGAGPFRLSQELSIPMREAQVIIDTYFEQYHGIRAYIDTVLEQARQDHYVTTLLGRRRAVWDAVSDNRQRREAAERMAINMPIQGTAAEMIKLAMIELRRELDDRKFRARMILQIHDELLFEVPEEEVDELLPLVRERMEKALPLSVPVVVDCGVGKSWYEAH